MSEQPPPPLTPQQLASVSAFIGQFRAMYGKSSTARVEAMLERFASGQSRYFDLDGIGSAGWMDASEHAEIEHLVAAVKRWKEVLVEDARRVVTAWADLPAFHHYAVGSKDNTEWRYARLCTATACVAEALLRFPRSAAIVGDHVRAMCGSGDGAIFSALEPGKSIAPHRDMANTGMSLHFGLIVPDGCTLVVGGEARRWEPGEPLLFNYGTEHTAHNPSDDLRVVLICDVWNPEVTVAERSMLNQLSALRAARRKETSPTA